MFFKNLDEKISFIFQSEKIKRAFFLFVLLLIAVAIYRLNRYTPLMADDFGLSIVANTYDLKSAFNLLLDYYFSWGGRVIVHSIAFFFLSMDKSVFNVANTLAYTLLNLLILFHALGKNFWSPIALIFANFMLFMFTPAFGQDFLWLDGAANYLWGIDIALLFLVPYRLQAEKDENIFKHNKASALLFLFFGIIAAWTNENISIALVSMVFVCIYLAKNDGKKLLLWQITGGIGSLLGALFLLLAPGNFMRIKTENGGQTIDVMTNFANITSLYTDPQFLLYPVLCIILFAIISAKNKAEKNYIIYLAGFFISMYAMIGSPYYTDRAKLGSLTLAIISAIYFYGYIKFNTKFAKTLLLTVGILLTFLSYNEWRIAESDVKAYYKAEQERIEQILRERDTKDEIILDENLPKSRYVGAWGLWKIEKDKNFRFNQEYAKFYKAKAVRVK